MSDRDFLFVAGLGRSGTTALTRVLASHRDIVLGMERFQRLCKPALIDTLRPECFSREKFLNFDDGYSSTRPEDPRFTEFYRHAERHLDTARYVGDKTTETQFLPRLAVNFPGASFVTIVRDVTPLAWSWEQRATNPDDKGWSASRDAVASVGFWNESMKVISSMSAEDPGRVSVLEYDSFFRSDAPLRNLLEKLDLPYSEDVRKGYRVAHDAYVGTVLKKERSLPGDVLEKIDATRDSALWEELRRIAL